MRHLETSAKEQRCAEFRQFSGVSVSKRVFFFFFLWNLCINEEQREIIMPTFLFFYATVINKVSGWKIKGALQHT